MNKVIFVLLGIVWALFGFSIIIEPRFYDYIYDWSFDFRGFNIFFGSALVGTGLLIIWSALRRKSKEFEDKFLICPKCGDPFNQKDVFNRKCPNCSSDLEDLEGFYERHPELKENEIGNLRG